MKKAKKGFTLIEMLVVIAIIAILSTVAVVGYTSFVDKANEAKAKADLHQIITYVNIEFADDGKWGELSKGNDTKFGVELKSKIEECNYFKDLEGTIEISVDDGVVTIKYTVDNKTAKGTLN